LIAILDYGSGNLRSALRAFEKTGRKVFLTSDPEQAAKADALVVPGVGAFGACMDGLKSVNGDQVINARKASGKPTLGICVGMQILFDRGVEHGSFDGVGALTGTVEKMGAPVLPHMGWNTVRIEGTSKLFKGVERDSFYFVHSYAVKNSNVSNYAVTDYFGEFISAIEDGSVSATQFHPEKSGAAGLKLISNWVESL
jgi:glutamine amidotransferase